MTKQYCFICLIFLHFNISAQINDLLKDNNIVWVGEFTTDFVVEGYKQHDTSDYINSVRLLKYLNTKTHYNWDVDKPLFSRITNTLYEKSLPFYHQHTLINRINPVPSMDTLEMIDPTTYEKKISIVYNCGVTFPIPIYYRAAQILFYDRKKKNFGLRVLAICPVAHKRDGTGNIIGLREVGWIKTNNEMRKINLNSANITFATRLATRSNSPSFEKDFKILKNTVGNIQQTFINDLMNKTGIDLYSSADYNQKLSKEERKKVFAAFEFRDSNAAMLLKKEAIRNKTLTDSLDSFPDFRPSIGRSISSDSVIFNGTKEIDKLKIVQEWYWDEKLNTVSVRLFGVAPMIKIYDNNGLFSYYQNIFFRLNDTQ